MVLVNSSNCPYRNVRSVSLILLSSASTLSSIFMKKTAAGRLIICLKFVVLLGGFTWVAMLLCHGESSSDEEAFQEPEIPDVLQMCSSEDHAIREKGKALQVGYDREFNKVLAKCQKLEPQWKRVKDEENGYLQWLQFCEARWSVETQEALNMGLPEDINRFVDQKGAWNLETVETALRSRQELLMELTRIGLLSKRSNRGISADYLVSYGYCSIAVQSFNLLCADAMIEASKGDAKKALIRLQAALGLANHLCYVETPTLIMETAGIIGRLTVLDVAVKQVLPKLKLKKNDYAMWREALSSPSRSFETVVLGESLAGCRGLVIPYVMELQKMGGAGSMRDTDKLYDMMARGYCLSVEKARGLDYRDLLDETKVKPWITLDISHLSKNSRELCQGLWMGWEEFSKAWVRSEAIVRQYDAAFAIMAGQAPRKELITGKVFVYDEAKRELAFPPEKVLEGIDLEPLILP